MDRSPTVAVCVGIPKYDRGEGHRTDGWSEHICNKIAGSVYKITILFCYL